MLAVNSKMWIYWGTAHTFIGLEVTENVGIWAFSGRALKADDGLRLGKEMLYSSLRFL